MKPADGVLASETDLERAIFVYYLLWQRWQRYDIIADRVQGMIKTRSKGILSITLSLIYLKEGKAVEKLLNALSTPQRMKSAKSQRRTRAASSREQTRGSMKSAFLFGTI